MKLTMSPSLRKRNYAFPGNYKSNSTIRPEERPLLEDFLYEAIFVPEGMAAVVGKVEF